MIGHPHTHTLCIAQDADSLYMGLEYCPNGELYEQLEAREKLQVGEAVQWAAEIVDILDYLRAQEVIHRWVLRHADWWACDGRVLRTWHHGSCFEMWHAVWRGGRDRVGKRDRHAVWCVERGTHKPA